MKKALIALCLALTLTACQGRGASSDLPPGDVVSTQKRSVTVKLDSGKTVTYSTSKNVARRCRVWHGPKRWPDCRSAF